MFFLILIPASASTNPAFCMMYSASQGWRLRLPGCDSAGAAKRSYATSEAKDGGWEELPHAQGQGQEPEEQPNVQGAVAVQAQEDLEELFHVQGQEVQQ